MSVPRFDRWLRRSDASPARAHERATPATSAAATATIDEPAAVDDATLGRLLDASGALMQVVGAYAHDTDARSADEAKNDAERWRRHLMLGVEHPRGTEAPSRGRTLAERDWEGAVRYAIADRRAEHEYVARTTVELRDTIWALMNGLHRVVDAESAAGRESADALADLRASVSAAAPDAMRSVALAALDDITRRVEARDRARDAQLESLGAQIATLGAALDEARREGATDVLTGLGNRRAFDSAIEHAVALHALWRQPVCLVLLDVDGLKGVNDGFGHAAGDDALRAVAGKLARIFLRRTDVVARVGGDEFAAVLRETSMADAARLAARVASAVAEMDSVAPLGISAGVAEARAGETVSDWTARADAALYAAKRGGRGRVERAI